MRYSSPRKITHSPSSALGRNPALSSQTPSPLSAHLTAAILVHLQHWTLVLSGQWLVLPNLHLSAQHSAWQIESA